MPNENENELKSSKHHTYSHTLTLINVTKDHAGAYLCHFPENEREKNLTIAQMSFDVVAISIPSIKLPLSEEIKIKEKDEKSFTLTCIVDAIPTSFFNNSVKWTKETIDDFEFKDASDATEINAMLANKTKITTDNTQIKVTVTVDKATKKHNGTYICAVTEPIALDKSFGKKIEKRTSVLIQSAPIAMITFAKAIGKNRIFLNWTVSDNGNSPISMFLPQFKEESESTFHYSPNRVDGKTTSMIIDKLKPNTKYEFRIAAKNGIDTGPSTDWVDKVQTLVEDPVFIPIVEVKGSSHATITIGWQPPHSDLLDYIHYYEVEVYQENYTNVEKAFHAQNSRNLPYMASDLKTATEYFFKVRACNDYVKECGNWSEVVNGTTMDGFSSAPLDVRVTCTHHNVSRRNFVSVEWIPPSKPNGIVMSYQVLLEGVAYFKSDDGRYINQTYGPKARNIDRTQETKTIYENVPPNTNYSVSVAAVTRSKKPGEKATAICTMPPTVPEHVGKTVFGKYQTENYNWIFKLYLPRVSERNGKICCYRIYMIRVGSRFNPEKLPDDLDVSTFEEIHNPNNTEGGAYLANVIESNQYQSDILLGTAKHHILSQNKFNEKCKACMANITRKKVHHVAETFDEDDKEEKEDVDGEENKFKINQ